MLSSCMMCGKCHRFVPWNKQFSLTSLVLASRCKFAGAGSFIKTLFAHRDLFPHTGRTSSSSPHHHMRRRRAWQHWKITFLSYEIFGHKPNWSDYCIYNSRDDYIGEERFRYNDSPSRSWRRWFSMTLSRLRMNHNCDWHGNKYC